MKKTITQRFFLSLCLMIVGCLWGSSAWAETITLSQSTIGSLLGSGGYMDTDFSYSGITWGRKSVYKNSGGIQIEKGTTKALWNKTAIPGAITQIVVKQNTNSSTLTVGSTAKPTTNRNSTAGNSTATYTFKASDKYQYFQIAATSSNYSVVTSIEITYEPLAAINVSADALTFDNVETGYNATKKFTLSGYKLTANSTASLTLDDNSNFSVSPTTVDIDAEGKITNKEITVTYAPTTTGEHSATLTIKSGETSKTVSLTGTGVAPKTHYTVSWMVNGNLATTTDVAEGEQLTLPANPEAIGSKVFIGWTTSTISGTSESAPDGLFTAAKDAPTISANITFHAVFAKLSSSTSSWGRIKTLAEITNGSYVIKSSDYILPSTKTSSSPKVVAAPTITDDEITGTVEESMIWQFSSTGTANQFYVRNADGSYLYANSSNTGLRVSSTKDKWTFTTNTTGYFSMKEANNNRYCGVYSTQDWRSYTSATSNYANSGKLELYKLCRENTYFDYATTVATLADRNLSFGETTAFDVYDNSFEAPTLTGATTGVTYASSNKSVATVNETTGAITLAGGFGTTTITASAAEDEVNGYLADEASYTLSVWPNSIAGLKTMVTGTVDFKAQLTNATITYVNGRNVYLQDANDAILLYLAEGHGLSAGKCYTGQVSGTATLYNGLREITSIDLSGITPTDNTIEPEVVTLAALNADYDKYESMYVKVAGVTTGTFTTSDPVQTTTLTQDEATLAFAAPSTITLVENNDYDFVGFLGMYNSTPQFKIYEESQATNKGKLAAGLAFEQASYTVEVNNIITVKATNASGAAITYSVDDVDHALVYENGEFMADAAGTYTITATCPATETHMAGTATCQVIVTMPASNISATTYYKQITSTDELVDGGVYLIVCEARNEAMGSLNSSSNRGEGEPITISGNTYTGKVNQSGYPYEITISQANDGSEYYNLYHAEGKYINEKEKADLAFGATGDNGWTISFDESGNAIISNKKATGYHIQRHPSASYYKNYANNLNGACAIQLYQKVGEMPIAQATGGITTYVADFAYSMPQHLVGHTVILAYEKDEILTKKAFRAGDEVPALTPLLIKSTEDFAAEETSKTYYPAVLNKTVAAYEGDNMLEYRRDESNMTKSMKTGSVYYYKLAIKNEVVGFYWGAEGGAAFQMTKPSTAYLTVPKTMSVQGFVLNLEEGETTGIATVTTDENAPIYNLQGIRMNGKNLPKGIYIQGGKKFLVK